MPPDDMRNAGANGARTDLVRPAAMLQEWRCITFLHWRYPAEVLSPFIPASLSLDLFDGSAWLSITPFLLTGLRPPFLPALPWISAFPETNCRTYVRGVDGKPAIWFFSLDAARVPAVVGARCGYGLPYAWSKMRVAVNGDYLHYDSERRWPDQVAATDIDIQRGGRIEAAELELFLTARFRLYAKLWGRLIFADVEHPPWPLEAARVVRVDQTLTRANSLPDPQGLPIVHFSEGVKVRIGFPKFVSTGMHPD